MGFQGTHFHAVTVMNAPLVGDSTVPEGLGSSTEFSALGFPKKDIKDDYTDF